MHTVPKGTKQYCPKPLCNNKQNFSFSAPCVVQGFEKKYVEGIILRNALGRIYCIDTQCGHPNTYIVPQLNN